MNFLKKKLKAPDAAGTQLAGKIPLIVDGGQSQVGIESTVLDLSQAMPRILRPGMVHAESLAAVGVNLADFKGVSEMEIGALRSPGLMAKHYSPKGKLFILNWRDEAELRTQLATMKLPPSQVQVIAHTRIPSGETLAGVNVIPHDAEAFARALYAELHHCDELGAELIIVEAPPDTSEWRAIADRLKRASAEERP